MNTTHKWNSYNDYSYQYYAENGSSNKSTKEQQEEPANTVAKAEEYKTNFLNIPEGYKVPGA